MDPVPGHIGSIPFRMENAKPLEMNWLRPWAKGLAVLLLGTLMLSACRTEPPEQRLRAGLAEMQAAVVEGRPNAFMEGVAEDFTGNEGMDRAALHNLLRGQVLLNTRIGATTAPLDISINGDHATVRFNLVLTGGSGRLLPERAQTYRVTSGWREDGGAWRLYYAEWESGI